MLFFMLTAAIMAICILIIYKLSDKLGFELSLSSLVICGIAALFINFSIITVTPFLTRSYYYTLAGMIVFAALGTTCYNKYLLYRHAQPAVAGAEIISNELTEAVLLPSEPASADKSTDEIEELHAAEIAVPVVQADISTKDKQLDNPPLTELPEPIAAIVAELAPEEKPEAAPDESMQIEPATTAVAENTQTTEAEVPVIWESALPAEPDAEPVFVDEPAPAADTTQKTVAQTDSMAAEVPPAEPEATIECEAENASDQLQIENTEAAIDAAEAAQKPETVQEPDGIPEVEAVQELEDVQEPEAVQASKVTLEPEDMQLPDVAHEPEIIQEAAAPQTSELSTEEDEPVSLPVPEKFAAQLAAMDTLDHLLDYAFERNSHNRKQQAIWTYEAALARYGDDAYAPFVVIEMVNIHKSLGNYRAAIQCLESAMDLPAVAGNSGMQKQFQDNLLYLAAVKQVLDKTAQKNLPLGQISKDSMLEIESLYKQSKSR